MRSKLRTLRDRYRTAGLGGVARELAAYGRRQVGRARRRLKARRVNRWKAERTPAELAYEHDPELSMLVQWFNQRDNVDTIADRLPTEPGYERIVCEDGSVDGSLAAWRDRLTRRNDFLLRSNDLHEIRAYTRAIGTARGDVVCLLQDDDTPPADDDWVTGTLALFDRDPDLAVVCGQSAWGLDDLDPEYRYEPGAGAHPAVAAMLRGDGTGYKDGGDQPPTTAPGSDRPFLYTPCVSVGPLFLRTDVFEELGGFDRGFADPGEPGMGFEVDFALRCWRAGYRVGYTPMGFDREEVGGTKTFEQQDRGEARREAWARLRRKHRDRFDAVSDRVLAANVELYDATGADDEPGRPTGTDTTLEP